jgi:UPF0755 protein
MRRALLYFALTCVVVLGTVGGLAWFVDRYPDRAHAGDGSTVALTVRKGEALPELATDLAGHGLIAHPLLFRLYVTRAGRAGRLLPGDYTLANNLTPREVLAALTTPQPAPEVPVTIPEGKNILFVAQALEAAGIAPAADVLKAARDPDVVSALGAPGPTLEGYLFPDTYELTPGTPAVTALGEMVAHQKQVWTGLLASHGADIDALGKTYGFDEKAIVTMASIVEKETGNPDERPMVAAVFLNRLRLPSFQPKLLQTDPTILYGCTALVTLSAACQSYQTNVTTKNDERIHRLQLTDPDNPYNTYTHAGLPPGPISNPGLASYLAVLQPDNDQYLYFVAKNDGSGTHYFSKTKAEHLAAVQKYQLGGN